MHDSVVARDVQKYLPFGEVTARSECAFPGRWAWTIVSWQGLHCRISDLVLYDYEHEWPILVAKFFLHYPLHAHKTEGIEKYEYSSN